VYGEMGWGGGGGVRGAEESGDWGAVGGEEPADQRSISRLRRLACRGIVSGPLDIRN
jgi:hypothetical protein